MHGRVDVGGHALVRDGGVLARLVLEVHGFVDDGWVVVGEEDEALGAQVEFVRERVGELGLPVRSLDYDVLEFLEGVLHGRVVAGEVLVEVDGDVVYAGEVLDFGVLAQVLFELGDLEAVLG